LSIKGYITVDVTTIRETRTAALLDNGDKKEWFPKAVLEDWPDLDETGEAIIKEWWAINKDFI